jgi:hypothetical protein
MRLIRQIGISYIGLEKQRNLLIWLFKKISLIRGWGII